MTAVGVLLPTIGVETSAHQLTFHDLGQRLFVPFASLIAYFFASGRYTQRLPFWSETGFVTAAGVTILTIDLLAAVLTGGLAHHVPRLAAILLFTILAPMTNRLVKQSLACIGTSTIPSILVSHRSTETESENFLFMPDPVDYRIVCKIDPLSLLSDPEGPRFRPLLARYHCEHLFIDFDGDLSSSQILADAALRERIPFSLIVPLGFGITTTHAFGESSAILSHSEGPLQALLRCTKTTLDVTLAALLLLVTSPLLLMIAFAIKLDGGPALFAHRRLGANGRYFQCLKFRTMIKDADKVLQQVLATDVERARQWDVTQKLRDDPRVTRLGRFLRKTSLDELPQLINVLRLEMSLVGPRPIVESETRFYGKHICHYQAMRPGVTGLWQVSGRSDTSYDRRVSLDTWYVNNWSIWHDIIILLKTIPAVLRREGAR